MFKSIANSAIRIFIIVSLNNVAHATKHAYQTMPPASLWARMAHDSNVKRFDMRQSFIDDCALYAHENNLIPQHKKNNETVRIATYNVHSWYDCKGKNNFEGVMSVIKDINADILILQEVSLFDWKKIKKTCESLGYYCSKSLFVHTMYYYLHSFGNMIVSKYPLAQEPIQKTFDADKKMFGDTRGYVKIVVDLPHQKKIKIYGTHLDVYDNTESLRTKEIQELIEDIGIGIDPCIIAGDFNAVRASDYQYEMDGKSVWQMVKDNHKQRTGIERGTQALQLLADNNFQDCFTKNSQTSPKFSVWSGVLVDFIWLNTFWNFPLAGCYVYYTAASDHLPIIMDVKVS